MRFTTIALRSVGFVVILSLAAACGSPEVRKARYMEAGDRYLAEKKYSEAILEYRNALKVDNRFGEARFKLAEAFGGADRHREAVREYLRAAELLPDRADVQLKAATLYLQMRDFESARKHADLTLKLDPGQSLAHVVRANALAGLRELPAAVLEIEQAIQLSPLDSRMYANLGTLHLAEGNRQAAEAAYLKAIEVAPKSVETKVAAAIFFWHTDRKDRAEELLKQAVTLEPENAFANRSLVAFYLNQNRFSDAQPALLRLAEQNDPIAILAVADHYKRTSRPDQARSLYERLREQPGHRSVAAGRLAEVDYRAGKAAAAYATIDEELRSQPSHAELLTLKARLLLQDRRLEEAEALARQAVQ